MSYTLKFFIGCNRPIYVCSCSTPSISSPSFSSQSFSSPANSTPPFFDGPPFFTPANSSHPQKQQTRPITDRGLAKLLCVTLIFDHITLKNFIGSSQVWCLPVYEVWWRLLLNCEQRRTNEQCDNAIIDKQTNATDQRYSVLVEIFISWHFG